MNELNVLWVGFGAAFGGVVLGALLVHLVSRKLLAREQQEVSQLQQRLAETEEKLQSRLAETESKLQDERDVAHGLRTQLETSRTQAESTQRFMNEKVEELQKSETRLQKEFERLAQRIFEQKSQVLEEKNQKALKTTLDPIRSQLESFRQQISQQFTDETKQRSMLQKELLTLKELNQQMTHEAESLTRALKGDTRQQGAWGEVILERILEQSGLREGYEYETQGHRKSEEGRRYKPDVIVHLPGDKDVVIDAKVSLSAYERYFNAETDAERTKALDEHVASVRNHIRDLGKKNYQELEGVRTLDYVLMFIPIEPAFLLAVDREPELIRQALDNQIMLVSPTNLLVALRTVHNIWSYEYQSQNARKIAKDAARLYDKFVGFLDDMEKIDNALDSTRKHYDAAMNKLTEGRGNLVGRIEKFRKLGVQPNKKIDQKLLDEDDDSEAEPGGEHDTGSTE